MEQRSLGQDPGRKKIKEYHMFQFTLVRWCRYCVHNIEEAVGTFFFLVMVLSVSIG